MSDHELYNDDPVDAQIDFDLWRRILSHALPYRRYLVGLGLAGVVLAIVDVFFPWVTGKILDDAIQRGGENLPWWIAIYAVLGALLAALVWVFILFAGKTATGYAFDVRGTAFARLQELSFSYYDKHSVGWLMARLTSDVGKLAGVIPWTALDLVWGTSLIIGIAVAMFLLNWQLALVVLAIVPPLAFASVVFQKKLLRSQRMVRKTNSKLTSSFNEGIMGVRTSKALVREEQNLEEFQVLSGTMYDYSAQNAIQSAVYLPLVMSLGSVGLGLALWRGGLLVGTDLTIGTMVAFMNYAVLFSMPIQELAARFTQLQAAQASAERLQALLDSTPEITDLPSVVRAMKGHAELPHDLPGLAPDGLTDSIEEVEFRNVTFSYQEGETVLDDVSLIARRGETIALVGATGSGKSTIASLLSRFYEPTGGDILVDGVPYRERSLDWWQSNFGIVLQTPHLFRGTIRENIRYGRIDASDAEVEVAAAQVNANAFIQGLEKGYETDVGEGGSRLSTGQRQLVSLARAVLADPQIFVMDEATSSVDTETERLIQAGIETVLAGRMSFVIAHRLSTIRSADQILVLDHGKIIERGTHRELLAEKGRYFRLYTNQASREGSDRALPTLEVSGSSEPVAE